MPDRALAKQRVGQKQGLRDLDGSKITLCGNFSKLSLGGVGIELFFRTIRWFIVIFVLTVPLSLVALDSNVRLMRENDTNILLRTAIGREERSFGDMSTSQALPWFGVTALVLLFLIILRKKQRTVAETHDRSFITAADYAVEVSDIPPGSSEQALLCALRARRALPPLVVIVTRLLQALLQTIRLRQPHRYWLPLWGLCALTQGLGETRPPAP